MDSNDFPRKILLVVTGLSPQIVTETAYVLAVEKADEAQRFVPTEIHIITTGIGAEHVRINLLSESTGHFKRLCQDYAGFGLKPEIFPEANIHTIKHEDGSVLEDIRDTQDNDVAANFITQLVREFTADEASSLHVSLAGGRKTMGYYLGYALSLYGRKQDCLSHVLVSSPYESNRDFYYPTPYESVIHIHRDGGKVAYDCRNAKIDLATIPFVRIREGLPKPLLVGDATFTEVVAEAQKSMPEISIRFNLEDKTIVLSGHAVPLPASLLAYYWLLAIKAKNKLSMHWSMDGVVDEYLALLVRIHGRHAAHYEQAEKALQSDDQTPEKAFFQEKKSKVNSEIRKAMGERLSNYYVVDQLGSMPNTQYKMIGLTLDPDQIHLPEGSF